MRLIFFSALRYEAVIGGRTRALAEALSSAHDVHFVEKPGWRRPDPRPYARRVGSVTVHHLPPCPLKWPRADSWLGALWLGGVRRYLARALGAAGHAVVSTPFWQAVLDRLAFASVSYDCLDHVAIHSPPGCRPAVEAAEAGLLARADRVFAVSTPLCARLKARTPRPVHLLVNGCPEAWFVRPLRESPVPTAGFLGALYEWVDYPLLEKVAAGLTDVKFRLVGPVRNRADLRRLRRLPNVELRPPVPFERAAETIESFSLGLVPFVRDEVGAYCNPLKMYEVLALGRPVLSTIPAEPGLPVTYAEDFESFQSGVRRLLAGRPDAAALRNSVRRFSWRNLAESLAEIVAQADPPRNADAEGRHGAAAEPGTPKARGPNLP